MQQTGPLPDLAGLPPGPVLAAALARIDPMTLPLPDRLIVVEAWHRQHSHSRAGFYRAMVALGTDDPTTPGWSERDWSDEIRAALAWTRRAADARADDAVALVVDLPLVLAALDTGRIDPPKAAVFAQHLIGLPPAQITHLCRLVLPRAPRWTTTEISRRLRRLIMKIDPAHYERLFRRAHARRRISACVTEDGTATITATITATGLAPDSADAAVQRIGRLAHRVTRAGHPGGLDQIRVDLFIGFLDGSLHTRTDDQITEALLASHTPRPADAAHRRPSRREGPARATATGRSGGPGAPAGSGRPRSEEPDTDTHSTRDLVRAHQSAPWRYALTDTDGRLIHAGTLRRRPTVDDIAPATTTADARAAAHTPIPPADPAAPGLVDLLVDATLLQHLTTDPAAVPPSWRPVLNEITNSRGRPLDDAPGDRFPHAALRRHMEFRDRTCTFTGCLAPAHRTDLDHTRDHTRDHAHGGPTTADDLGPACRHDHGLKQRGWTLTQPEPGVFVWRSPLGREYRTRADPLLPPPPPPLPVSDEDDACCADPLDDLDRSQPLIVWRPATDDHDDEPRPPPHPITELDDEPPF